MPQTKAQVEYMRQQGIPVFELDTLQVLDDNRRHTLVQGLCRKVGGALQEGSDVVVHTSNDPGLWRKPSGGDRLQVNRPPKSLGLSLKPWRRLWPTAEELG